MKPLAYWRQLLAEWGIRVPYQPIGGTTPDVPPEERERDKWDVWLVASGRGGSVGHDQD